MGEQCESRRKYAEIRQTATLWDTIFVSGGKRGLDIEIGPHDLVRILSATVADISG
jgi:Cys-tRNA(Pro)/Cys-tRNA(Cys) deacylase